ncbi:FKBP-type peptidyl-prolyl cis-trans isomerase [Isoalcanivorax indicus]|uniref:FKBP-type peptidyl-prolyl cis-trans isomerase n=1 Tax=Isoalcanivorax indicus TaxID=2202653 RepID=UPI000DB9ABDB|nr:peptidylprolyl isomerase [Isoalcanivorax indicus]
MKVEAGKVVSFHYALYDSEGTLIEQSSPETPTLCLMGAGNIIRGVEAALTGREAGDHIDVQISPEDGYGHRDENMTQRLSAKYLRHAGKLRPGMRVPVQTDDGQRWVTVLKVGLKTVDVDANHPLAGQTLRFVMDIHEVRDASAEEKSHGHAHGPGGHQH